MARDLELDSPLLLTSDIDVYTDYLDAELQKMVGLAVSWATGGRRVEAWWTLAVKEAVRNQRSARRDWCTYRTEQS